MTNDAPIHLRKYSFFEGLDNSEDSVTVPVRLTQSSLDGMNALINYCKGLEDSGKGKVPGSFELVIFYRTIKDCLAREDNRHQENIKSKEDDIPF